MGVGLIVELDSRLLESFTIVYVQPVSALYLSKLSTLALQVRLSARENFTLEVEVDAFFANETFCNDESLLLSDS